VSLITQHIRYLWADAMQGAVPELGCFRAFPRGPRSNRGVEEVEARSLYPVLVAFLQCTYLGRDCQAPDLGVFRSTGRDQLHRCPCGTLEDLVDLWTCNVLERKADV